MVIYSRVYDLQGVRKKFFLINYLHITLKHNAATSQSSQCSVYVNMSTDSPLSIATQNPPTIKLMVLTGPAESKAGGILSYFAKAN